MKNYLLPGSLLFLAAGLLTWALQEFIGEVIVSPLLYIFWFGYLIFETIPQVVIWGLFIFLALLMSGRSLFRGLAPSRPARHRPTENKGRIESWQKLIEAAQRKTYYRWQLAQPLRELTLNILAHHQHQELEQIQQRLREERLELPPEINNYLQASIVSFSHFVVPTPGYGSKPPVSPLELEPERIIQFLEDKFERLSD